ncbi:MAG TPA: nuclear transport factor 2 family protein [Dehalococcoidales bacterium]
MTDQQIKDAIRGFLKSSTAGDVKGALSFFTEDAVWISPQGTFKGTAQIEKLITWMNRMNKDNKVTETGIGIITQGDTGVIEHNLSGIYNGMKWESPTVCIYEFKNGKIANIRAFMDRLTQAQQAAKGMFAKWAVNAVVNGTQKGLK